MKEKQGKLQVELLRFESPDGSVDKSIFVTKLASGVTSQMLRAIFLEFGAINWVYVNESNQGDPVNGGTTTGEAGGEQKQLAEPVVNYALIKFYCSFAAKEAVRHTNLLEIMGRRVRISHPSRPHYATRRNISLRQCIELANYYLGFDGWTSSLVRVAKLQGPPPSLSQAQVQHQQQVPGGKEVEQYVYRAEVVLTVAGVEGQCEGVGYGYMNQDENLKGEDGKDQKVETVKHLDKGTILSRVRKMAVREAQANAFSKIVLIILSTGKATAAFQEAPPEHAVVSARSISHDFSSFGLANDEGKQRGERGL